MYLICTFPSKHYDIEKYPAIKKHLLSFGKEKLEQTGKTYIKNGEKIKARKRTNNKWFETQDSIAYSDLFLGQKIVYPETTNAANFYLDNGEFFIEKTCFMITGKSLEYLIATLSSTLFEFAYKKLFSSIALGKKGYQYNKHALLLLPISHISESNENEFLQLVKTMENLKGNKKDILEIIDSKIYAIYNLNDKEKNFVLSK